jgi:hypothetical protein
MAADAQLAINVARASLRCLIMINTLPCMARGAADQHAAKALTREELLIDRKTIVKIILNSLSQEGRASEPIGAPPGRL